ncbi:MAG TPA: ester cyclase [Bacteroidia bacterium]|nr:ester cyclase [Bacteroidia bacterium]HNS11502.1 ester cyclase [Bacteroidia bacterium]
MKNKILLFSSVLLISSFFYACSEKAKESNTAAAATEQNKAAMTQIYTAFSTGNTAELPNYVDPNIIEHAPDPNIKETGLEGLTKMIETYRASFPDLKMEVMSMVAEGDVVTAHFKMTGTNTGPMGEMPATNRPMDIAGVDIIKFKDGKAVEHWGYYEEMKMMEQMGMMQEPAGMPMDPAAEAK